MDSLIQRLANFERTWGALVRWLATLVFLGTVWTLVHFGDAHYVRRSEFNGYRNDNGAALKEINGKLDSVIVGLATNTQHTIDIEKRLDDARAEKRPAGENLARQ